MTATNEQVMENWKKNIILFSGKPNLISIWIDHWFSMPLCGISH